MTFFTNNEQLIRIIALNIMLACSLALPLRLGQFQVAQPAFMAVGAYAGALLSLHSGLPFAVVLVLSVLMAAAAGALIGSLLLSRLQGVFLALSSFVVVELLRVAIINVDSLGGPLGLYSVPSRASTWMILLAMVGCIVLTYLLDRSSFGVAMKLVRDDRLASAGVGLSVFRIDIYVFSFSAAIAGLAGCLRAHVLYSVSPNDFGLHRILDMLTFVVVGGIASVVGPVIGSAAVTWLGESLAFLREWRVVVNGCLLLIIVLFLPGGLASLPQELRRQATRIHAAVTRRPSSGDDAAPSVLPTTVGKDA